jgi:signal transduction histidine kinase/ABC-type multidrug transport system ATPase subunit
MSTTLPWAGTQVATRLEISGLGVSFGRVRALNDVNLELRGPEVVALTGEPGAGKTTLVRCLAGDITPGTGTIKLEGNLVPPEPGPVMDLGIGVVWQDLELCDNLDVAGNILLGRETRRLMLSHSRFHASAAAVLQSLHIPIRDTTQLVGALSGGQRQLLAMAKAIARRPRLLVLDEPTASVGLLETEAVERLILGLRDQGMTVLLATRDTAQMFRLADRIVVLRQGSVVAEVDPGQTHPDDVSALASGQPVDTTARRQLTRLHGLADRLVYADPSSSLSLILSALGAALGADRVWIHVVHGSSLRCTASLGFAAGEIDSIRNLPVGPGGGAVARAVTEPSEVVVEALGPGHGWAPLVGPAEQTGIVGCWALPVLGPDGVSAVITVFRRESAPPGRDDQDLLTLYAGYAASAIERDRLLDQVTARNRVLETTREMLETLAGPVPVGEGLGIALGFLRRGLQADEVVLLSRLSDGELSRRAHDGSDPGPISYALREAATRVLAEGGRDGSARTLRGELGLDRVIAVPFNAPAGPTVLLAAWTDLRRGDDERALVENAAHTLRLALEREEAGLAHQEAAALRRSRELQRGFLSRLSHELRTPLTAIRGYASSLLAPDVTWDDDSQNRFLDRIAAESARLGRLVDDLLDFSAIESDVMRLQHDWCNIPLVVEAAVSCLPEEVRDAVLVSCDPHLPPVWADHDRLEQVFVNLLGNALRHNPPGTRVEVSGTPVRPVSRPGGEVELIVSDDGLGFPLALAAAPFESARRQRSSSSGAGLGLSIARGIVAAHDGTIELVPTAMGTRFCIRIPIEGASSGAAPARTAERADAPASAPTHA